MPKNTAINVESIDFGTAVMNGDSWVIGEDQFQNIHNDRDVN